MHPTAYAAGEKVFLTGMTEPDLEALGRWWDDPRVTAHLEMGSRPTRAKELNAFWKTASEADDAVVFAIREVETERLVGTCGLYLISWQARRAQFNILIGESDVWDRGYGGEAARLTLAYAFRTLNLNSVNLGVNADNARAMRSYEKVGFTKEGVRRQFIYRDGAFHDMAVYTILRTEFEAVQ